MDTHSDEAGAPPRPTVESEPSNLPQALKDRPQWVVWKYERRDDAWTKVPYSARSGRRADSTEPCTWSTFPEAVHALGEGSAYAGVGYVFSEDDPYCGVDLDGCLSLNGVIVRSAAEVVESLASYTEVSPSGMGLKVIVEAAKPIWARCRSKAIGGFKETEIYDRTRFFALTGRLWTGSPTVIHPRQAQIDELCRRLWPKRLQPPKDGRKPATPVDLDDEALLKRMFRAKNGDKARRLYDGDTSMHGGDDSRADQALCNMLAFWTGRDRDRMDALFRGSGLYREKWERDDYRSRTLANAIEGCDEVYTPGPRTRPRKVDESATGAVGGGGDDGGDHPPDPADVPTIHIDVDEHRVIDESVAALSFDPDLYQRGAVLVRVLREPSGDDGVVRPDGAPTITQVPSANLRDRLTRHAKFTKYNRKGDLVEAHPPPWLTAGVEARGEWPGVRILRGVSDAPILRPDGSVWQTPGYDAATGVLFVPGQGAAFPPIPVGVNEDDASAALDALREVVCDFRFEAPEHESAWLAGLLTPMARFAFLGPAPLFLIDANVRGAGKGLLAQTIGYTALGREMPVSSYAHDSEEMRKKVTSIAICGDRTILLDNLEGTFGNDVLDRALTSTRWKDRILGRSEQVELPLLTVWYATGNNVQVAADTTRRIIHIRLDVLSERPEDRTDFRHPDLVAWLRERRPALVSAALTILSAYVRAGMPRQGLTPFGSFEGWSRLVREAVVWLGLPDPCLTRVRLAEQADTTADALTQLVEAWRAYDPHNIGVVAAEALNKLYPSEAQYQPRDEASVRMRAALENLVGCPPGRTPSIRQVGNKLKHFRRRVVEGAYLDIDEARYSRQGRVWRVFHAGGNGTRCDSGDSGESFSAPYARETL